MDISRFDRFTLTFAHEPSRRDALRLLGAAALGASGLTFLGSEESEAKKRRKKRKKKNKNKKPNCNGKCGGKCPRCSAGTTCQDRDECTTAFCDGGVCTEPDDALQCGLDTDGGMCARRDNQENGESYCSRVLCSKFTPGGSCSICTGQEICSPAGVGNIECWLPCGS